MIDRWACMFAGGSCKGEHGGSGWLVVQREWISWRSYLDWLNYGGNGGGIGGVKNMYDLASPLRFESCFLSCSCLYLRHQSFRYKMPSFFLFLSLLRTNPPPLLYREPFLPDKRNTLATLASFIARVVHHLLEVKPSISVFYTTYPPIKTLSEKKRLSFNISYLKSSLTSSLKSIRFSATK